MTNSLDKLVDEILADSRTKAEEIRRQGRNEIEEETASAQASASREADQIIRSGMAEAEATRNRLISQATQKARVAYLAERNRILQDLSTELREKLEQFVQNDASYHTFLLNSITQGMRALSSETATVLVSKRDLARFGQAKLLEEALQNVKTVKKARFSDESITKIGGAVVTSEDGRIRVDCTIDARLELMQPRILAEISKALFSD